MTYAELYGNIKKRPLKGGLANKMMGEMRLKSIVSDEFQGLNKFVEVGDTMSKLNELVSPFTHANEGLLSSFENPMAKFGNLASGIHNALSVSNEDALGEFKGNLTHFITWQL